MTTTHPIDGQLRTLGIDLDALDPEVLTALRRAAPAPVDPEQAQRDRVASGFHYDQRMEDLAALADQDPESFDRIPPTVRMQLGFYASAKAAAAAAGIDTTRPKDTQ